MQIILFEPDASILPHLASQYAIIFSQEYALQLNADDNLIQLDTLPVGTGPYKVKNYFKNQYIRLVRNDDYWKKEAKIENVIIDLSTDKTGRLIKFLNGECHITSNPEISQLGLLEQYNKKYYTKTIESMNLSYLAFNFDKPLMRDVKLRRAISQAIDRKRIIETIYHHNATIANNIIPNISWAATVNTPDYAYDYNPKQATDFLQNKKLNLTLWVVNEEHFYTPSPIKMAELIKADLAKVGVTVNIQAITRTHLNQQLKNSTGNYDLILTGWAAGNLDPDSFMRPILSCHMLEREFNLSHWCYPPFDEVMNNALATSNLKERANFYNIAQELILSEVPIIPLANAKRVLIASSQVQGIHMTPFGNIDFATLFYQ